MLVPRVQGLLYKVEGVALSSPSYSALSDIMVLLSCVFIVTWGVVVLAAIAGNCRTSRQQGSGGRSAVAAATQTERKDSESNLQRCRRTAVRLWHALAALLRFRGECICSIQFSLVIVISGPSLVAGLRS